MRAARVVDMLMILQRRGRLTARELGVALEVSERTILRDVEALSEAGVPILASRGSGGGIELLDGFQTRLTGLTNDEAESLFLAGQPQVAHRLGLGAASRRVRHKLSNAIPTALAAQAESLSTWFLHDPDPWAGHRIPHGELRRVAGSIRAHRRIELHLSDKSPITVEPLGLVLKTGSWHLVVTTGNGSEQVICLDDLRATRLTTQRFEPPPTFTLDMFWDGYLANLRNDRHLSWPDRPVDVEASGVVLRAFRPDDEPDLHRAFADAEIARWNPGPSGPGTVAEFLRRRNDWSEHDHASWAVADAGDRLVGSVSLHKIDVDQADAEVGYWVAPWARRKGNATGAVRAASQFAFAQLSLHRLYLYHAADNSGSCGVARAAGFVHEGTLHKSFRYADGAYHDEHLHGLLADDFEPPAAP